jgi:hypothetical protein
MKFIEKRLPYQFMAKILTSLLASAFFSFTLLFFGPSTIYFTNVFEFFSSYSEISYLLIIITFISTFLSTIILSFLKKKNYQKAISLLIVFSILLYLQGNILIWDYGVFDGSDINWQKKIFLGIIDSSIWIGFIIIAIIKSSFIFKVARKLCLAFLLIQSLSLIITYSNASQVEGRKFIDIENNSKFEFSEKKNIILLVLDTFQTDVFQELLLEDPKQKKIFKDFTYFRNALSGFPTTKASVPLMLTGLYYQNKEPYLDFIKKAYTSNSLPKVLKENGYKVHLFPVIGTVYLREDIANNFVRKKSFYDKAINIKDTVFIYDIVLFRFLPHFFKKYIWNDQTWFLRNIFDQKAQQKSAEENRLKKRLKRKKQKYRATDVQFFSSIKDNIIVNNTNPVFKFYHLKGLHPPVRLNCKCELITGLKYNRQNYKNQAICVLSSIEEFLKTLKAKGVYNNSMIFIVSDHGPGNWGLRNVKTELTKFTNLKTDQNKSLLKIKSGALPLFLVKPFKFVRESKIKISDAPVSLSDISKSILSELQIQNKVPGVSVFDLKETDVRNRRFLYHSKFRTSKSGYFNKMTEYNVTGFSWIDQSWSKPIKIYTPK